MSGLSTGTGLQPRQRLHDLDALRSFAMLIGIVLHATFFLVPTIGGGGEVYANRAVEAYAHETAPVANPYAYLGAWIHGWRMPVFFMMSGFFSALLWQRRGLPRLIDLRVKRLALPFALSLITVIPVSSWYLVTNFAPEHWVLAWLDDLYHIWFLWHLMLISIAFLVLVKLGVKFSAKMWWLLVPLTWVPVFLMKYPVGAAPSVHIVPDPAVLAFHSIFFFFGVFMYQRGFTVTGRWGWAIIPATLVIFPSILYMLVPVIRDPAASNDRIWMTASALDALFTWSMCFGMMGLFRVIASKERSWVRYISDATYWIYLWHYPLVLHFQRTTVDWAMNPHLKLLAICVATFVILLVTYKWGVRYTPIGTMLNGKRTRPGAATAS